MQMGRTDKLICKGSFVPKKKQNKGDQVNFVGSTAELRSILQFFYKAKRLKYSLLLATLPRN